MMATAGATLSRRVSEVMGVALFATALIWLIALASYEPADPVWFFSTGGGAPANFVGRVGAFLAEVSFQLFGYASFVLPAVIVVAGWHYFWCRHVDAVYTKVIGATLALACTSAFLSLALGSVDLRDRPFRAGGSLGELLAGVMSEYLSRMGAIIVVLTVAFVAVILATQFSFGRLFSAVYSVTAEALQHSWGAMRLKIAERRKARQRREVIAKHVKKGTAPDVMKAAAERAGRPEPTSARARVPAAPGDDEDDEDVAPMLRPGPLARATPPVVKRDRASIAPPLPLT
nr:DNA translocase FtsK 4TM domain-containing protein [Acidobacteriota bacterium]